MSAFLPELQGRLAALRAQGLARALRRVDSPQGTRLRVGQQTLLNFSSNDYLGLAGDPRLKAAAREALERFGVGAGASRLVCGSLGPHHALEEALAQFKGTEAALSFSSGYATALGTIAALVGQDDILILDRLVHACFVDAARLCRATVRLFAHNDLNELEDLLKWAALQGPPSGRRNTLVVTESVFSMDGDVAPLREIVELKDRYGAWLLVDEAHATGLYGPRGQGRAAALGVAERIEVQLGTLGKALGVSGGYIAGAQTLIQFLIHRARTFIFSTAPPPALAAAAAEAVRLVQSAGGEQLRQRLWQNVARVAPQVLPGRACWPSAILPLVVGDERAAVELSDRLRASGIFVPAIRYPAVARGQARLRVTLSAAHTPADVAALVGALEAVRPALPAGPAGLHP